MIKIFLLFLMVILPLGTARAENAVAPIAPHLIDADTRKGRKLAQKCRTCHTFRNGEKHKNGPNLWGIIGRPAGKQSGYSYSNAMKTIGIRWGYEELSQYLWNPKKAIPKTKMVFTGIKRSDERADLIAYLRLLSNKPLPLPESKKSDLLKLQRGIYDSMPAGTGREAVYFTCRSCHSIKQFLHVKNTRREWSATLDKMVSKNGMSRPDTLAKKILVDYLTTNYGRREPTKEEREDLLGDLKNEDDLFNVDTKNAEGSVTNKPTPHTDILRQTQQAAATLPHGPRRDDSLTNCQDCHSMMLVKNQDDYSFGSWQDALDWRVEGKRPIFLILGWQDLAKK